MSWASSQTQPQEVEIQNAQPRIQGPHPQRSGIGSWCRESKGNQWHAMPYRCIRCTAPTWSRDIPGQVSTKTQYGLWTTSASYRQESEFDCLPHHEDAFTTVKNLITEAPVLSYYDVNKEVTKESDSSEVGLGVVLTQDGQPVACASHTYQDGAQLCTNWKGVLLNWFCDTAIRTAHSWEREARGPDWSQTAHVNLWEAHTVKSKEVAENAFTSTEILAQSALQTRPTDVSKWHTI